MPIFTPPLSLYVHLPWCVRKCPYCDFNSHEIKGSLPESLYVDALLQELNAHRHLVDNRPLVSIFFGGGTPSLFSPAAIASIIDGVAKQLPLDPAIEITLEANPGTTEYISFTDLRLAGINRISLGIQSFQDDKLKTLGRIHTQQQASVAIEKLIHAGINNFNIDLMYGLPEQSVQDALHDLEMAIRYQPPHLSWYQLTIEPNTVFYKHTPALPRDDTVWEMQLAGQAYLQAQGLQQYEISAYARTDKQCKHNRNYWEFGDYLGIGAGAHSKITRQDHTVIRFAQVKQPRDYLLVEKRRQMLPAHTPSWVQTVSPQELMFEFMLNALRLTEGVPLTLFTERTGLPLTSIATLLQKAHQQGLLNPYEAQLCASPLGQRYLNNLTALFLP